MAEERKWSANPLSTTMARTDTLNATIGGASQRIALETVAKEATGVINVKLAGAVGDGVADDTAELAAVVATALSTGQDLYFSDTYLTTASIPNLHLVRKFGPGTIKRGSDTFSIDPDGGDTNTIYVAATGGSDANDGLSASQPFATIQAALDALKDYGPVLNGTWTIQLAAGTYAESGIAVKNFLRSYNFINVNGPDVSGGVPTAIIDGNGLSGVGITANRNIALEIKDVKLITFTGRTAVLASEHSNMTTDNVHVDGCAKGIKADELSKLRVKIGIIENSTGEGVEVVHANASIGLAGSFSGPTIKDCVSGVEVLECSDAHVDDLTVQDCTNAIVCSENARATLNGTVDLKRNTTALLGQEGGIIEKIGTINFNDNTVDANTTNEKYFGGSNTGSGGRLSSSPTFLATQMDSAFVSHTGDTLETLLKTYTGLISSNTFVVFRRTLKVIITTGKTGSAGTAIIRVKLGANTIATYTLPATAATGVANVLFSARNSTLQRTTQNVMDANGVVDVSYTNTAFTLDDTVGDLDLTITGQLGNSGDTLEIVNVEIYETG